MAKKDLTVTLYISELIYDVHNKTYLTGRSRNNGSNHEETAYMQTNDDEEEKNQIVRSLGNAFATLKTKLSEYLFLTDTTSDNELLDSSTNLTLSLSMPSNYNQSTADSIAQCAHRYLVNSAIGEWFTITNKVDANDYAALANVNLAELREAINKRVRPTRSDVTKDS